jgi:hypothetical protein
MQPRRSSLQSRSKGNHTSLRLGALVLAAFLPRELALQWDMLLVSNSNNQDPV